MVKVKVFDEDHEDDLCDAVNQFISDHPAIKVCDIKFSTSTCCMNDEQIYCFSALLIYMDSSESLG